MSASASILQLMRAHYREDETAFAYAASQLAKRAKPEMRKQMEAILYATKDWRAKQSAPSPRQVAPPPAAKRANGILQPVRAVGFPDLLLDEELQEALDEVVIELEYRSQLAARGLRARNRLLFWGPPGNGKTSAGGALANALGLPAFVVSLPDLVSGYLGGTGSNLGAMFAEITDDMVVVFDELDAIGTARGEAGQSATREQNAIVNTLLTQLDKHQKGVLVGTTNRPEVLDPALRRRFDELVHFPEPSLIQKAALSERLCEKYQIPPVDVSTCDNFDRVTKEVTKHARRAVMRELLAQDEVAETEKEAPNGSKKKTIH